VMHRDERPPNLPAGTVWRDRRRDNIPGSVWLANVGYGALNKETEGYFRRALEELTAGDRARPLVFYCLTECWMSWNAAKRAVALGYARVHWYSDGSDGWAAAGLPLAKARPHR
jgi:PQQ-dependent catabolism-associated CXXCW motif protein